MSAPSLTPHSYLRAQVRWHLLEYLFWLATILIVGALTFFPALVLGPIAEFFAMKAGLVF